MALMFDQIKSELKNSKIYIYSISITACILSIFGFVIFIASAYNNETADNLPSPSPTDFAAILGAQSNNQSLQQPGMIPEQAASIGPDQPISPPTPTPTPSPTPKISPTPLASPSVSPSISPSPTANLGPTPNPSPSPSNSPTNSDTSGPVLSEIKSTNIESRKVTIEWKTNEDSDSKVEYGKETSYGSSKDNADKKSSHSLEIADLEPNTTYHYRVTSKDGANNSTTSGDNTFTTLP
jgi:hypothetical protein